MKVRRTPHQYMTCVWPSSITGTSEFRNVSCRGHESGHDVCVGGWRHGEVAERWLSEPAAKE